MFKMFQKSALKALDVNKLKKGKPLSSHRSTTYPCFVPNLGDLAGAGRERLTPCKLSKLKPCTATSV